MAIDDRYGLATAVDEGLLAGPVRLAQAALLARPPRTVAPAVERRSRLSLIALAPNKTAKAVKAAILKVLQPLSAQVHTLTYDNGKEFAYHMEIAKVLKANGYFAHPYHSWERGLNENTNGLPNAASSHMGGRCVAATSLRCCGGTPGDQDCRGTNELSKIESILGTRMSQNLSRDRRLA